MRTEILVKDYSICENNFNENSQMALYFLKVLPGKWHFMYVVMIIVA